MPLDTTSRKIGTVTSTANFNQFGFINDIDEGALAIRADSIDKGVHLIFSGLQKARTLIKIERVTNFVEQELYNIAELLDNGKLLPGEKKLGQQFFRIVFTEKSGPTPLNMAVYFKSAPNTLFVKRLRVLVQSNEDHEGKLETLLNDLLKQQPELLAYNILKAQLLYDRGKYAESISYCDKALVISPTYAFAYNLKGQCYGRMRQPEKEITIEEEAIKLFPNYVDAFYNKSSALYDLDKYRDAAYVYRRIEKLKPQYLFTNYYLARCYKAIDMPDSALYYANLNNRQYPDDGDGYNLKGDIYYANDDYPTAVEWYTQAIKLQPDNADNYEDRGDAYYYWEKVDTALADFEKAANLKKKNAYLNERIGDCYYKKEQYDKSVYYHQKALRIDPDYKYAYVSLDLCYNKIGKYELGIEACKKAISIDSTYDTALGNLGWGYYCVGKFDDCIKFSYKALKYNEKATYAMFNIALATLCKGDYEKAKELYFNFYTLCKEKNYEMTGGAVTDLKDLIKKKISVEQASTIIRDIFKETP